MKFETKVTHMLSSEKSQSLALFVFTHWDTYVYSLERVYENRLALKALSITDGINYQTKAKKISWTTNFGRKFQC